jgi:hypothetical protein
MLKQILSHPPVIFFMGAISGLIWTAFIFGTNTVHKSIFKSSMVYIDGRAYQIREIK